MPLPNNPKPPPPPVAQDDALTSVAEDSGLRLIPIASLLSNDSKGPLTITAVSNPVGGTVAIKGSNIEFTPTADFNGTASFDYTVSKNGKTDTGGVSFVVTAVNDAPVATDDVLTSVAEDSGKRIISFDSLRGNDSAGPANESDQTLTITAAGNAVGGTVAINGSNVEFTPDADFNGTASFDYTVSDNGLTDTGNVSFAVTDVYDPPEINIIRDDLTTDTILHGTAGADIFVFDASATISSTYNPYTYESIITDSIVGFDPVHDQIALVNFDVRNWSSYPETVAFGTNFNTATAADSQIAFRKPGLHHEINIDTMLDPSTLHLYANDPYANLSSVPVPPPSPEPNVIRDNPASPWDRDYLYGTDGADVFVFNAATAPTRDGRAFIVGFDPTEDRIALVNIPDSSGSVWFDEASSINWQENDTTPFDGRVVWMQSNGQARYVQTVDVSPIEPSQVDFYHGDPFAGLI